MSDEKDKIDPTTDRDFFATAETSQKLNLLLHLAQNGDRIVLVRGARQSGKSTLLAQMRKLAPESWKVCRIVCTPMLQPAQLMEQIGRFFGADGQEQQLDLITERLENLTLTGRLPVLMIDDADQLPLASVIALFRLYERRRAATPLVKILLFASEDIDQQLRAPQLQAMNLQLLQIMEMPVLNRMQTETFITHLLQQEGLEGKVRLSPAEIERMHHSTDGLLGRIEQEIHNRLQGETVSAQQSPGFLATVPMSRIVGGGLILLVLLLLLLFQDSINALFEPADTARQQTLPKKQFQPEPGIEPLTRTDESGVVKDEITAIAPQGQAAFVQKSSAFQEETASRSITLALPEVSSETAADTEKIATEEVDVSDQSPEISAATADDAAATRTPILDQEVEITAEASRVNALVDPEDTGMVDASRGLMRTTQEARSVRQGGKVVSPAVTSAPRVVKPIFPEPELPLLGSISPSHYALQLIALQDSQAAENYIVQHGLQGRAHHFHTQQKGRTWYPVVYGDFVDRDAAVAGIAALPVGIDRKKVWPRSYASIQEAIATKR